MSGGGGDAVRVNFAAAVRSAQALTKALGIRKMSSSTTAIIFESSRPYRPPAPANKPPCPESRRRRYTRILPCVIAAFPCPFDGVSQDTCTSTCGGSPPDPNAAAGAGRIVEVVNDLMRVTDRLGAVQCGGPTVPAYSRAIPPTIY